MANLTVRNIDEDLVKALKEQALEHGISAEAEHRLLLSRVLFKATQETKKFSRAALRRP